MAAQRASGDNEVTAGAGAASVVLSAAAARAARPEIAMRLYFILLGLKAIENRKGYYQVLNRELVKMNDFSVRRTTEPIKQVLLPHED